MAKYVYNWSKQTEAVARAIAFADGWTFDDDTYSAISIPQGRAIDYWVRAVVAIDAYNIARAKESETEGLHHSMKPIEPGLFGKYLIAKADGSGLDSNAKYFVLRYDADSADGKAARYALLNYIAAIESSRPELASDLRSQIDSEAERKVKHQGE